MAGVLEGQAALILLTEAFESDFWISRKCDCLRLQFKVIRLRRLSLLISGYLLLQICFNLLTLSFPVAFDACWQLVLLFN